MTEREFNRFQYNEWRKANLDRAREIHRKSYVKNRDAIRQRLRERYASDPEYRARVLATNLRSRENRKV